MKNILIASVLCSALIGATSCKHHKYNLKMDVVVLNKKNEKGTYDQKLRIVNQGNKALDKDWTLYTTLPKKDFMFQEDSPITMKHIDGTLYEIKPTEYFSGLKPSDTLNIDYKVQHPYSNLAFLPDGAYIIFDNKEENGGKPLQLSTEVFHEFAPDSLGNPNPYYVTNLNIYDDNLNYMMNYDLRQADILPSVKDVKYLANSLSLTKNVQINSSSKNLENEQNFLANKLASLGYSVNNSGVTINLEINPNLGKGNGYNLNISPDEILITGQDAAGVFYGIETLISMLMQQPAPAKLQCMEIEDYPDLHYRGMMIDVARNFIPKKDILMLLDVFAFYKMNKLHLHLTDDEGWRLEIPGIEELTEVASKRGVSEEETILLPMYRAIWDIHSDKNTGTGHYSRQDFIDILNYAKERHISVIPEVDFPGHSKAAIIAMNERCNKYKDTDIEKASEYLLYDPNDTGNYQSIQDYTQNTVNAAMPSTYNFVKKVIDEIDEMYSEAGVPLEVLHIGGDEVPYNAWDGSKIAQEFMAEHGIKNARELKDYFVRRVLDYAQEKNIRIGGWQELLMKGGGHEIDKDLKDYDVVSYCWFTTRGGMDEIPYKFANDGFDIILCNVNNLYFSLAYDDNFQIKGKNWAGYVDERSSFDFQPYDVYNSIRRNGNKRKNANQIEAMAQAALIKTPLENKENIIGVQGQIWSENVRGFEDMSSFIFPKVLGLAERGWNTDINKSADHNLKTYDEAINLYNDKLSKNELNNLHKMNVNYHVTAPGIKIKDGKLLANSRLKNVEIRYTMDGSEPTAKSELWTAPVEINGKIIKGKSFFNGKQSPTSVLVVRD